MKFFYLNNGFECNRTFLLAGRCDCGLCSGIHFFKKMWRVDTGNVFEFIRCDEFPTIKDLNTLFNVPDPDNYHQTTWEDIRKYLTKDEFVNLPYNIHVFTINLNTFSGHSKYYKLQLQEIPDICATGPTYEYAMDRLEKEMAKWFDRFPNSYIPKPEEFDRNFHRNE